MLELALYWPMAWVEWYRGISEPTRLNRPPQPSRNRGKLCIPPFRRDSLSVETLDQFPASGPAALDADSADRLLPAMIPARIDVSKVTSPPRFLSAGRLPALSGYMAPTASSQFL